MTYNEKDNQFIKTEEEYVQMLELSGKDVTSIINKWILKFTYERLRIVYMTLKKKNKAGGLTLPDFKTNYKATLIMTMWIEVR